MPKMTKSYFLDNLRAIPVKLSSNEKAGCFPARLFSQSAKVRLTKGDFRGVITIYAVLVAGARYRAMPTRPRATPTMIMKAPVASTTWTRPKAVTARYR